MRDDQSNALTIAWRTAYQRGIATDMCDRIVGEREVPGRLAGAVYGPKISRTRVDAHKRVYRLTRREREVLYLTSVGWRNQAVARALGVTLDTVWKHMSSVMEKLDAPNASAAVAIAIREFEIV